MEIRNSDSANGATLGNHTSKSILDQVDAYLHDSRIPNEQVSNNDNNIESNDRGSGSSMKGTWDLSIPANVHIDLDDIDIPLLDYERTNVHINKVSEASHIDDDTHINYEGARDIPNSIEVNNSPIIDDAQVIQFSPLIESQNYNKSKMYSNNNNSTSYTNADLSKNLNTPFLSGKQNRKGSFTTRRRNSSLNVNGHFSPLTSPAIIPSNGKKNIKVTKSSAHTYYNSNNNGTNSISASAPSSVSKQFSVNTTIDNSMISWDFLPESSMVALSKSISNSSATTKHYRKFSSGDENQGEGKSTSYPKVILPSHSNTSSSLLVSSNVDSNAGNTVNNSISRKSSIGPPQNPEKIIRATESPVIKPNLNIQDFSKRKLNKYYNQDEFADNDQDMAKFEKLPSASINPTGNTQQENDLEPKSKKEMHKAAERGRRDRMNTALKELSELLPEELKENVQVPSKATTVELACIYIRQLLRERST